MFKYAIQEKISKICGEIENALNKIPESIEDIQKRAALSVPLLKSIEDSLTVYIICFYYFCFINEFLRSFLDIQ